MMIHITDLSTLLYVAFCTCIITLALHAGNFQGSSKRYYLLLNAMPALGLVTILAFLISLWIHTSWYTSLIVVVLGGVLSSWLSRLFIRLLGGKVMSPASVILAPVCGVLMFLSLPAKTKAITRSQYIDSNDVIAADDRASEKNTSSYHTDDRYKYEFRTGTSGSYSYNYDVVGTDENGDEVTGNVDIYSNDGSGTITDANGDEQEVEVHWVRYGHMVATDEDGSEYELDVAP